MAITFNGQPVQAITFNGQVVQRCEFNGNIVFTSGITIHAQLDDFDWNNTITIWLADATPLSSTDSLEITLGRSSSAGSPAPLTVYLTKANPSVQVTAGEGNVCIDSCTPHNASGTSMGTVTFDSDVQSGTWSGNLYG